MSDIGGDTGSTTDIVEREPVDEDGVSARIDAAVEEEKPEWRDRGSLGDETVLLEEERHGLSDSSCEAARSRSTCSSGLRKRSGTQRVGTGGKGFDRGLKRRGQLTSGAEDDSLDLGAGRGRERTGRVLEGGSGKHSDERGTRRVEGKGRAIRTSRLWILEIDLNFVPAATRLPFSLPSYLLCRCNLHVLILLSRSVKARTLAGVDPARIATSPDDLLIARNSRMD